MLSDVFADLSAPGPLPVSGFDPRGHLGSSVPIFAIRYVLLFVHNVDHFEIVTAAGPANNSFTGRAPVTLIYGRPVGRAPVQWILCRPSCREKSEVGY